MATPTAPPTYDYGRLSIQQPEPTQPTSSQGYPGPPQPGKTYFYHRLTRSAKPRKQRYTPQAWYLGQFGFTGFYVSYGTGTAATKLTVGVYLSNGHDQLRRPIRCRVSMIDISGKDQEEMQLIDETLDSVEAWAKGKWITLHIRDIVKFLWEDGSALFRYDTEWC